LCIVPSQKKWHGESTWVTVLPWKVMPSCSDEAPAPVGVEPHRHVLGARHVGGAHGHVVVDRSISPRHGDRAFLPALTFGLVVGP
jgi:hypothetical protein